MNRRLSEPAGLLIDRSKPIRFHFEGHVVHGFAGDTVASALAASGRWLISRSFKYRRPRGLYSLAGHDGNALVQIGHEPNVRAELQAIEDGLVVRAQNYTHSLYADRGQWVERFARFMPVGFFYRAMFRPQWAWRFWERRIRNRAGLGRVDVGAPHRRHDHVHLFCDVAVIGGGASGLTAALEAADAGAETILVDENPWLGGALAYAGLGADSERTEQRRQSLIERVHRHPGIRHLASVTCQGLFDDGWIEMTDDRRLYKVRTAATVVATGAFEQGIVFRNNDLPGVMLMSAAQRLLRLYGVCPGSRIVIVTSHDDGYRFAFDLMQAGAEIAAVADLRRSLPHILETVTLRQRGVRLLAGHTVFEAIPRHHGRHVGRAVLARITREGECLGERTTVECDAICVSSGYIPAVQLLGQCGTGFGYDRTSAMVSVERLPPGVFVAGAVNGTMGWEPSLAEGRSAGWSAARHAGYVRRAEPPPVGDRGASGKTHPYPIFQHPKGKDFVDFDEDLQTQDIADALAEGFDHVQLLKRYSTLGMGPSQGRLFNVPALRLIAKIAGRSVDDLGFTTFRPPFAPEKFGVLAGRGFAPARRTAMHHRHAELGAVWMTAGVWYRPAHYGADRQAAIRSEVEAVRQRAGLIDVSTLGGIEIRGPEAAEFVERIYTGSFRRQPTGRARYALACDQTGAIVDDGVACRLDANHFYVTATTSAVDAVFRQMQWWNAQWRLDVDVANVTAAYAGVNVAGPAARSIVEALADGVDLSADKFPYLGVRTGTVAGIPARLLRVGFVGELGYEIHVPAGLGEALWDALMDAGKEHGIRPFGVEAQRVLRLEKGHVIVGQDTDGLTFPHEAGLGWAIGRDKPFFVGQRAIAILAARPFKRRLVGFVLERAGDPVPEESHLVVRDGRIVGRVTSVVRSPTLNTVLGLAYVGPEQAEIGQVFDIKVPTARRPVWGRVAALPFYDPGNARQEL